MYIYGKTLIKYYCKKCNTEISYQSGLYGKGFCQSCAATEHGFYSKNNPNYNKCMDCHQEIDPRAKRCCSCAGKEKFRLNPPIRNPKISYCIDCHKQLGNSAYYIGTKRCNSCEVTRRYRLGLKNNKGRNSPNFGNPPKHLKRIKYKNYLMRSSWEVAYAKYLDKQNVNWQYESRTFDLGEMTYTPDFYLPETDTYIEIKGWFREKDKIKMNNFKIKYSQEKIIILMKKDLENLGVLC
jgi:hypothetical protein